MDVRFEDGKEQWKLTAAEARALQNPLLHSVLNTLAKKAGEPLSVVAKDSLDNLTAVISWLPKPKQPAGE